MAVFLIAFVPLTNAIQIQTIEKNFITSSISFNTIKNMDAEELIVFMRNLVHDYPQLSAEFERYVRMIENGPSPTIKTKQIGDIKADKNLGPQQKDDNQTILEKIYWMIFNYRVFRLCVSVMLFLFFQSKITLWRTTTWAIRLLRWTKIGILLGFINPGQQQNQTPTINFQQDTINKTLTVISVSQTDVLWSDIAEIGAGSCDPFPEGNVTIGDILTNCTGILVLQYVPTYEILGVFEFD